MEQSISLVFCEFSDVVRGAHYESLAQQRGRCIKRLSYGGYTAGFTIFSESPWFFNEPVLILLLPDYNSNSFYE